MQGTLQAEEEGVQPQERLSGRLWVIVWAVLQAEGEVEQLASSAARCAASVAMEEQDRAQPGPYADASQEQAPVALEQEPAEEQAPAPAHWNSQKSPK